MNIVCYLASPNLGIVTKEITQNAPITHRVQEIKESDLFVDIFIYLLTGETKHWNNII